MSLAVCVNANAEWYRNYFKADELREKEAYYANIYSCSAGHFICWDNSDKIRIECEDGIFHYTLYSTKVRIGLYKGNELIELIKDVYARIPEGDYNHAYIDKSSCYVNGEYISAFENGEHTGGYNIGYKIIHHLKYVGSVRIIATKYSGPDFEITIPMNPNIKTYIPKEEPQKPEPIVEEVSETPKEEKTDTLTIAELWKSLDTLEVFKRPTTDEIWEDFKKATINKQEIAIQQPKIEEPKIDEIWESYENAVRYIKYNDASYLETTYFRIEHLFYANKKEMRRLPKDSNELKLKKQQIKIMKSKMEEIDNKYFELTNKYIYQG
jgi:hypothetical protein